MARLPQTNEITSRSIGHDQVLGRGGVGVAGFGTGGGVVVSEGIGAAGGVVPGPGAGGEGEVDPGAGCAGTGGAASDGVVPVIPPMYPIDASPGAPTP